jgi:dihydroneopterin aldolase
MRDAMKRDVDYIHVYLRDCEVPLYVGIHDHEKPEAQPVIVHVEAMAPLTRRYDDPKASAVTLVIDYERLHDFVVNALPKLGHIAFLESVAERIIAFCFEDPRIQHVRVRLEKPEAFEGKTLVGIEMQRERRSA